MSSIQQTIQKSRRSFRADSSQAPSPSNFSDWRASCGRKTNCGAGNCYCCRHRFFNSRGSLSGKSTTSLAAARPSQRSSVINPLDQVASAGIARSVAQVAALSEATAVSNQADGETTQLALSPTTSSVVAKPAKSLPKLPLLPLIATLLPTQLQGEIASLLLPPSTA